MDNPSDMPTRQWYRKRHRTTIAFAVQCMFLGMDYSLTFLTLYLYIKDLVKPSSPKLMYGIVSACYLLSAVLFSMLIGRLVDKSRRIRLVFFVANLCVIVGNIVYALPFSVAYLIAGRFVSGIGGILRSVVTGELARVYDNDDVMRKIALMGMTYGLGFVVGPAVNFIFKPFHFTLGTWEINYTNLPSLFLAFVFVILQIINYFAVADLSMEFDLKEMRRQEKRKDNKSNGKVNGFYLNGGSFNVDTLENEKNSRQNAYLNPIYINENGVSKIKMVDKQINGRVPAARNGGYTHHKYPNYGYSEKSALIYPETSIKEESDDDLHLSAFKVMLAMGKKFDLLLLLISAAVTSYYVICFEIWLTLVITDVFHWTIVELTAIIFAIGVGCAVMCLFFVWKSLTSHAAIRLAIFCFTTVLFCHIIFLVFKYFKTSLVCDIILLSVFVILYVFQIYIEDIFLVTTVAKMVRPEIQTYADAIRLAFSRIGSLVALLCSAIVFDYLIYVSIVGIVLLLVGVTLYAIRLKNFTKGEIIL